MFESDEKRSAFLDLLPDMPFKEIVRVRTATHTHTHTHTHIYIYTRMRLFSLMHFFNEACVILTYALF